MGAKFRAVMKFSRLIELNLHLSCSVASARREKLRLDSTALAALLTLVIE